MSTANDFLQKLQSATVKSTVQQKQKSRPNASAAELSKMLMAATRQGESVLPETTSVTQMPVQEKKSYEAVKEKSGAADLSEKKAAASSLQESVVRQEMSTQQKEKKTKLPLSESKENEKLRNCFPDPEGVGCKGENAAGSSCYGTGRWVEKRVRGGLPATGRSNERRK